METAIIFLGLLLGVCAQQSVTVSQQQQGSQVPLVIVTPIQQQQSGTQQLVSSQEAGDQQDNQGQQQQQAGSQQQSGSQQGAAVPVQQPSLTFTEQRSGFQQIRSHGPVNNGQQIRQPGTQVAVGQGQVQQQNGQYVFDLYKNVPALDSEAVIDILATSQPGVTFPLNAFIPNTGFDCANQATPGYFADSAPPSLCQAYYRCDPSGNQTGFLCPNQTVFNQLTLTCDYYYNVDCAGSKTLYNYANTRLYQPNEPLFDTPPQGYISRLSGLDQNGASIVIGPSNGQNGQYQAAGRDLNAASSNTNINTVPATTQRPASVAAVVGVGAGPGSAVRSQVSSSSNANVVGVGSGPGVARAVVNVVPVNIVSTQQNTGPVVPVFGPGTGAAAIVAQRPARPVVVVQARTTTTTTTTTTPSTTTTTEETTTEAAATSAPATEVTADAGSSAGVATLNGQPAVSTVLVPAVPVAPVSATSNSGVVILPVGVVNGAAGSQFSSGAVAASSAGAEDAAAVETSTSGGGVTIVVQPATVAPAA